MPWWPAFWEHNYFALSFPLFRSVLTNNFVRGAVSGLGVVNLFAGFADLAYLVAGRPDLLDGRDSEATLHDGSR